MNHLDLIGCDLKNEFLNDLFETYDVQVVYDYDRTYDNLPDQFIAEVPKLGLDFIFNNRQILQTLFIKQVSIDTFNPFEEDEEKIKKFSTKPEALNYAKDNSIPFSEGAATFEEEERDWVLLKYDNYSIHYEFVDSKLKMITLQNGAA